MEKLAGRGPTLYKKKNNIRNRGSSEYYSEHLLLPPAALPLSQPAARPVQGDAQSGAKNKHCAYSSPPRYCSSCKVCRKRRCTSSFRSPPRRKRL